MPEPLWAPWRMEFIAGKRDQAGCFLCSAASAPPGEDARRYILARSTACFALMNLYPYSNGHLMVAPLTHTGDLEHLDRSTAADLMGLTQRALAALRACLRPDGFNLGFNLGRVAGAGVADHLHQHVVPRWNGDTNFMPVVADTKVMSEHIRVTYDKVRAAFDGAS
jgi:ATP adenylyltransferase